MPLNIVPVDSKTVLQRHEHLIINDVRGIVKWLRCRLSRRAQPSHASWINIYQHTSLSPSRYSNLVCKRHARRVSYIHYRISVFSMRVLKTKLLARIS